MAGGVIDPLATGSAGELIEKLRRLRAWTGLSFRDIERRARQNGDRLPASTVASALRRDTLPHLDLLTIMVRAMGEPEERVLLWVRARRALAEGHSSVATTGSAVAPCLLPAMPTRFVGREAELLQATETLRTAPATILVTGPAGIGKTTFALRLAYTSIDAFPDGQLHADLHGFGDEQVNPSQVLGTFLRALGARAGTMPAGREDRLHLYRTLLSQRRVLVVLDNAGDADQITDLLPSGPGCAAIVTSRSILGEVDGTRIHLEHLSVMQAVALLGQMAGATRLAADPGAAGRIAQACGMLPLAVWVAGAQLASQPHLSLGDLAQALADERSRLDKLTIGNVAVRASVELSYRQLSPSAQWALRMLGLCPETAVAPWALAALLDTTVTDAERLLAELLEVHLVEAVQSGAGVRHRMHDLVGALARQLVDNHESAHSRDEAMVRLLDAALDLAETADTHLSADFQGLTQHRRPRVHHADYAEKERLLADPLGWFDGEHTFLLRLADRMLRTEPTLAGCLAVSMTTFLQIRSHFDDWRRLQQAALAQAVALGDTRTALKLHRCLGELATIVDEYPAAIDHFQQALRVASADEPEYTASATAGLAYVYRLIGRHSEALAHFEEAARLARASGNVNCLIYVSNGSGVIHLEHGEYDQADDRFRECLALSRSVGYRPGEAQALRCLGLSSRARGWYPTAAEHLAAAAQISVDIGDRLAAAHAWSWLGDVQVRSGQAVAGRRLLAECLAIYRLHGNRWGQAAVLHCLANAQLMAGQPLRAKRRAQTAVVIWRELGSSHWLAVALRQLGDICDALSDERGAADARAQARAAREQMR